MKKQRKSTTLWGAEPGTGKSNTIKGIYEAQAPYIDLEDNMKKQRNRRDTMKIKTSELAGRALDWAVAKAENASPDTGWLLLGVWYKRDAEGASHLFQPSTDWSQGGPIIEREGIKIAPTVTRSAWMAQIRHTKSHPLVAHPVLAGWTNANGPAPLIAAMRCFVSSKLGDEVDVPLAVTPLT